MGVAVTLPELSEWTLQRCSLFNPILPGGVNMPPPPVFLHHPKTAQDIKLTLSDFKDTP